MNKDKDLIILSKKSIVHLNLFMPRNTKCNLNLA